MAIPPSRASTDSSVVSYDDGNANAIDGTATANPMHAPGIAPPPGGILGQGMATGAAIASQTAGVVNTLAFVERKRGLTAVRLDLLGDKAYGGEDGSDAFWFDYWRHVKNEHPAIGIVGSHPAHPYTKCSRLFSEMVVSCFAFMIAAFDAEANATDPNKDVGGFTRAVLIVALPSMAMGALIAWIAVWPFRVDQQADVKGRPGGEFVSCAARLLSASAMCVIAVFGLVFAVTGAVYAHAVYGTEEAGKLWNEFVIAKGSGYVLWFFFDAIDFGVRRTEERSVALGDDPAWRAHCIFRWPLAILAAVFT